MCASFGTIAFPTPWELKMAEFLEDNFSVNKEWLGQVEPVPNSEHIWARMHHYGIMSDPLRETGHILPQEFCNYSDGHQVM